MISRPTTLLLFILAVLPAALATSRHLMMSGSGLDYSATLALLDGVSIPADVAVPSGHVASLALSAEGHQHYRFNGTAWALFNATAKLYSDAENSVEVGRHYFLGQPDASGGQPTWEILDDGHHDAYTSVVTAIGVSAVSIDSDSITWNILEATSHGGNTYEPFGGVTYVQRLQTYKGLAPSATSNILNVGNTHDSKYKALYVFYVQR